jgi:hypothetical protein
LACCSAAVGLLLGAWAVLSVQHMHTQVGSLAVLCTMQQPVQFRYPLATFKFNACSSCCCSCSVRVLLRLSLKSEPLTCCDLNCQPEFFLCCVVSWATCRCMPGGTFTGDT